MKKRLLLFCLFIGYQIFAQIPGIPDSISYQAVLRDAAGNVLPPGTSGTLNFKIYSDFNSASPAYEENHNFTTNSVGLVQLYIGGGAKVGTNTFASVNWAGGSANYQVSLNGSAIGSRQAFASVPYALYAKSSGGGSLPPGLTNQTMYYDATAGWKATNNLANDGNRVGVGIQPGNRVKLHVFTNDVNDSVGIFSTKLGANNNDAAFRGFVKGTTNNTQGLPIIYGAEYRAYDNGNGYSVGASGFGNSGALGTAIGLSGQAGGPATSTIIGIYASVDTLNNPNTYAAVFDKGKIAMGGPVYFPNSTALAGSIFKIDAQKRGYWAAPGTSTISLTPGGIININPAGPASSFTISALSPTFSSSGIGTIVAGAYPNYFLNIPSPTFSFNSTTGLMSYSQNPYSTSVNLSPSLTISSGTLLSIAGSTIGIPALGFWNKPSASVLAPGNLADNVGIGTNSPSFKLEVSGNTRFADVNTQNGFVSTIENNYPAAGQSGGVLHLTNNFSRTISNKALLIENFTTKIGGSGSIKTGLEIQSTGSWAPATGQVNIGLLSNVSGADYNYSAIFTGGQVGINNNAPKTMLAIGGSIALKKVTTSGTYSMTVDDCIVEYSAGGTITLPQTSAVDEGHMIVIRNRSVGPITVNSQGADYISRLGTGATGGSTTVLAYSVMNLYKSGIGWVEM